MLVEFTRASVSHCTEFRTGAQLRLALCSALHHRFGYVLQRLLSYTWFGYLFRINILLLVGFPLHRAFGWLPYIRLRVWFLNSVPIQLNAGLDGFPSS
jgi:hypothetical protein